MRISRPFVLLTVLTIAVPIALTAAYTSQAANSETTLESPQAQIQNQLAQDPNVAAFRAQMASATNISSSLSLLGTVEANETAALGFQSSGEVADVLVQEDDFVEAGTVLARLTDESARAAYDNAQLALERAQINLETLLEPASDSDLELARLAIASAQASYSDAANTSSDSQIQQAQLSLQQAQNNYDLAVYQRTHMSGSDEEVALADAQVGAASFNLEIARLRLQELENPTSSGSQWSASTRVQSAQVEYQQLLEGPTEEEVTRSQLSVQVAEEQVAATELALSRLELTAPVSGYVTALNIAAGDTVGAGMTAIELTDLSQLWLTAPLHELDLDQVSEGMAATVTFDALPGIDMPATLERIGWVGAETDGIVEFTVSLKLDTSETRLRPGMTGEATLALS